MLISTCCARSNGCCGAIAACAQKWQPNAPAFRVWRAPKRHVQPLRQRQHNTNSLVLVALGARGPQYFPTAMFNFSGMYQLRFFGSCLADVISPRTFKPSSVSHSYPSNPPHYNSYLSLVDSRHSTPYLVRWWLKFSYCGHVSFIPLNTTVVSFERQLHR